ncbi:site-specific integrase [Desulfoplanes sp.]
MSKRSQAIDSLHPKIRQRLTQLGLNIQEARKRRRLSENDLARQASRVISVCYEHCQAGQATRKELAIFVPAPGYDIVCYATIANRKTVFPPLPGLGKTGDSRTAPTRKYRCALRLSHLKLCCVVPHFEEFEDVSRFKRKPYAPIVLSRQENNPILDNLCAPYDLAAGLLYGYGHRLLECLRLPIQDISLDALILIIHDSKGKEDRISHHPCLWSCPLISSMKPSTSSRESPL